MSQSLWNRAMSFDFTEKLSPIIEGGLNPFGTGQCLSTDNASWVREEEEKSQSLWNRAMSFDCSGVLEPCVARLPRATSQLFLMFE